jgi:hypothetical protein
MSSPLIIEKLTLFSVLPPQALLSNLESGFIAEPADKVVLQHLWEKANEAYKSIGHASRSFSDPGDFQPIENVDQSKIESMLNRIRLYAPYDSHPTNIYNVRIGKLVTPQLVINPLRAEKRSNITKDRMSPNELFDLSFESAGHPEIITRQTLGMAPNGGALLFTSYDEDIRLHHPPQYRQIPINKNDPQSPSFESVCMPVGGGMPFASALKVQIAPGTFRLILNNGIHRLYKLAEAGYEWCPLVVSELVPLEFPDPFVDIPRQIILDPNSNPPLITDFLNADVVIPLKYFMLLKTIRLNWNFEQYVTVLK